MSRVLPARQAVEAMNRLRADHREVIIELFYRRPTASEAAEVLGVPPGTVSLEAIGRCTPFTPHWKNEGRWPRDVSPTVPARADRLDEPLQRRSGGLTSSREPEQRAATHCDISASPGFVA